MSLLNLHLYKSLNEEILKILYIFLLRLNLLQHIIYEIQQFRSMLPHIAVENRSRLGE